MTDTSLLVGPFTADETAIVLAFTIPGDPFSKQRPRWNGKTGTTYTPSQTRHREAGIAALARTHARELFADGEGLFSLRASFHVATGQRRDIDNMLKLLSDALTGVVWADDSQVVEMFAYKRKADRPGEARTEVAIARLPGTVPQQHAPCVLCRRVFKTYPSWRFRNYCSRQCFNLGRRRREPVTCAHCRKVYSVPRHERWYARTHRFCSKTCKTAFGQETRTCAQCGVAFLIAKSYRKKTCSRVCAAAYRWQVDRVQRVPHMECRFGHSLVDAYVNKQGGRTCRICGKERARLARRQRTLAAESAGTSGPRGVEIAVELRGE